MKTDNATIIRRLTETHRLNQPNFEFDRDAFMVDLFSVMKDILGKVSEVPGSPKYSEFKHSINICKTIYEGLSLVKKTTTGRGLTKGLWSAFFAKYVFPFRESNFPEIHYYLTNKYHNQENEPE